MSAENSGAEVSIALFWHSLNSDNLGVGALTYGQVSILEQAARSVGLTPRFTVIGWRDTREFYSDAADIGFVPIRMRHLFQPCGPLGSALKDADIVFDIGAGDSFADIYGFKRFLTVWMSKFRTILAGKPIVLSPQTIGPFTATYARSLARWAMNRCALVMVRDSQSERFARDLGIQTDIRLSTDVAMVMPPATRAERSGNTQINVGVNVSGLLMNGGYTGDDQFRLRDDYKATVRAILDRFQAIAAVKLHFIGHVQSETNEIEDDQRAGLRLAREYPGSLVSPVFSSPVEAKEYISKMDFFVGARMHASIAAFSTGVPVVPMAYSRKFAGLFSSLGYNRVADCRTLTSDEIVELVLSGFEMREMLAAEISKARGLVDGLVEVYRECAAHHIAACVR